MTDLADEVVTTPLDTPVHHGVRRTPRLGRGAVAAFGLAAMVLGLALVWAGTAILTSTNGAWRFTIAAAGIAGAIGGLHLLLRGATGHKVQTGLWLSVAWLAIVVLAAVFADALPLSESRDTANTLTTASLQRPDFFSEHPLGTDRQGLDILGGIVYGARVSLIVGFGAVLIGGIIGGLVGLLAGFYRGASDSVAGFLTDSMMAFPPLILLLALVTVMEPSVRNVTLALALLGVPTYIRISRAATMVVAKRESVLAARVLGARSKRLIFKEILPNVAPTLVSYAFVIVAVLIVAEASLSYLGLSVQRPNPTWGNMIAAGQATFDRHPHLVAVPGIVLFLTVFSLNRVGEAARAAWAPTSRR